MVNFSSAPLFIVVARARSRSNRIVAEIEVETHLSRINAEKMIENEEKHAHIVAAKKFLKEFYGDYTLVTVEMKFY